MVKNTNISFDSLKQQIQDISSSIAISEESRINFTKKSLICSIKNLKDFMSENDRQEIEIKLEEELQSIKTYHNESILNGSLSTKIGAIVDSQQKEEFVSYEDIQRKKRKKQLEEQNTHLIEIFSKVKEEDKSMMRVFIKNWFMNEQNNKKQVQNSQDFTTKEWCPCKQKIISVLPYSYFFIETIYEEIIEMSSIYCKLDEQNFFTLLDVFSKILQNMKLGSKASGSASSVSIQFVYRMVHISMRVMWKKNSSSRSQPIELLCQHLGKKSKQLQNQQIFIKLNDFLEKKKVQKKTTTNIESPKGMMDSLMKGMQQAMNMKKQIKLTEEQHFGCLTQLTYIMANLLTPNEIGIPTLRKLLGKGENTRSFQYLKSILFEKKDQLERQKVFFRTQIKQRMEKRLNEIIKNNKIAQQCLKITARTGFLCQSQLNLRLVCKQLQNVHQQILYRLEMTPQKKWPHLIPFDRSLKYAELKQQTISKGLSQATEQIIILDVNRSLHNHTQLLSQQTLRTLLRVYGFKHVDIGYCQGMNYIAGYLYIKVKDEETGYRMFEYLMQNRFRELFANEFEVLKVKLYQFDRLLAIFHPEIGDHFKKQGITSECYIVAWIITIFASSYQYTMESYLIDLLWQRFIISGWCEFYRFVLALFSVHKQEIIELTYDKAMHFLGGMAKSDILISSKEEYMGKHAGQKLESLMEQFQISQQLLESLEKEYQLKEI